MDKPVGESVRAKGLFRVQIMENGVAVGDSGWRENQVVNLGFDQYLCQLLADAAGSKQVSQMLIGTGSEPGAADTSLEGELASRRTVATSTSGSKTVQFAATFHSSVFSTQGAETIKNLGLANTSAGGTIFAGNTYDTSQWQTNQDVNATYEISFS
jgi:hypothetical protein